MSNEAAPISLHPSDLESFYGQVSRISDRDRTLDLSQIRIGEQLLDDPVAAIRFDGVVCRRLIVVCDDTVILRNATAVKPFVVEALEEAGIDCVVVTLTARDGHELHTTPDQIAIVRGHLTAGVPVVVLGSGTVTDVTKHAVHEFERESGERLSLTVVQTANSVCAFTSGLAVVTTDGVKRTVPSRLPDHLVLDTTLLAQAPREYTLGGIGDASVAASSIADYRLANMLEVGSWEPVAELVVADGRERLLRRDPALADPGIRGAEVLSLDLSSCGLAMTFAGESAPLSGLEHVTSHMLDLGAEHFGRAVGNHGSQCGLATALVLIAFEQLVKNVDVEALRFRSLADGLDPEVEMATVRHTFEPIDSTGAAWRECWSDYRQKLETWTAQADAVARFQKEWPRHRAELASYLADPEEFLVALAAAGHPLSFEEVTPGIPEEQARWAFANARLMRKRISVADVLYFSGIWNDEFVDQIFERFHTIRQFINTK